MPPQQIFGAQLLKHTQTYLWPLAVCKSRPSEAVPDLYLQCNTALWLRY